MQKPKKPRLMTFSWIFAKDTLEANIHCTDDYGSVVFTKF
ncbi:hypothetical protein SAMN06295970_105208 [Noviherbaspirillum suwonense]|uniref:Uncharacterized protein n=1 Tax=Noviherbaspirillum suwonense TaxID=1224511 RepID=A0ABY1Q4F0_9BURK|nr:hypothetical protein SAMN06295970_105208 [Noviherbaspirillum suwonense]